MTGLLYRMNVKGLVVGFAIVIAWAASSARAQMIVRPTTRPAVAGTSVSASSGAMSSGPVYREWIPRGFHAVREVPYVLHGSPSQTLNVFVPDAPTAPRPLIVWIHGGAWMAGDKAGVPGLMLLTRGYTMASINYRLSGEAIFPAQIDDCRAAIRFLRANAGRFDIDPNRIGVWGDSAGGHLAALLGVTNGQRGTTYLLATPGSMAGVVPKAIRPQIAAGSNGKSLAPVGVAGSGGLSAGAANGAGGAGSESGSSAGGAGSGGPGSGGPGSGGAGSASGGTAGGPEQSGSSGRSSSGKSSPGKAPSGKGAGSPASPIALPGMTAMSATSAGITARGPIVATGIGSRAVISTPAGGVAGNLGGSLTGDLNGGAMDAGGTTGAGTGGGMPLVSSDVQAVCDWFGPTDLLEMGSAAGGRPIARLLGAPQAHARSLAIAASPAALVGQGKLPPFLIMHGDVDPIVPLRQSQLFYARLKQAGADVKLLILPHSGHGDGLFRSNGSFWAVALFFDRALQNDRHGAVAATPMGGGHLSGSALTSTAGGQTSPGLTTPGATTPVRQ